ncbi:MAG: hypothetical protein JXR42_03350 [Gammaproteobacteria bacterium]|nr:hypothetical protein [Gammaproteobacteria bacterium]
MRFFSDIGNKVKGFAVGAFVGFCTASMAASNYIDSTDNPNYLLVLGAVGAAMTAGGIVGASVTPSDDRDDTANITDAATP